MASNTAKKTSAAGKKPAASKKSSQSKNTKTNTKSSAAKKKTASASTKQTKEPISLQERETANPMILKEAALWLVLAVCILLFISYFGIGGYIGEVFCDISFGIFGIMAYLFPFLLFISAAFWISNGKSSIAGMKFAAAVGLFLCLCSFAALFAGQHEQVYGIGEIYSMSAAQKNGGGVLGGCLCQVLCPAVGAIGTGIVLAILSIICIVLITQKSFMRGVQKQSTRVYQNAKESSARRREAQRLALQQQEEPRLSEKPLIEKRQPILVERESVVPDLKIEQARPQPAETGRTQIDVPILFPVHGRENRTSHKVTGVTMNTQIQGDPAHVGAEIHEIQPKLSGTTYTVRQTEPATSYIDLGNAKQENISAAAEILQMQKKNDPADSLTELHIEGMVKPDFENRFQPSEALSAPKDESVQPKQPAAPEVQIEQLDVSDFPDAPEMVTHEETVHSTGVISRKRKASFADDIFRNDSSDAAPSSAGTVFRSSSVQQQIAADLEDDEADPKPMQKQAKKQPDEPNAESAPAAKRNPRSSEKEIADGIASVEAEMAKAAEAVKPEYVYPPIDLLKKGKASGKGNQENEIRQTAAKLQQTLNSFGVHVTVTNVSCGPSVTRYELLPEQGVKVSKIVALSDDIKLNLAAADIRIEAPIPGKAAVGIEVPNAENSMVALRDLLESDEFQNHSSKIAFATGMDIAGKTVVSDIAKMPHLLVAGATGSGKSVCINTIIMSILYKAHPDEVKLIMIDPKVVELSVYNGIPHLFIPVVTDPKKAAGALNWAVAEMTDRYNKFAEYGVRDLKGYNKKVEALDGIEDENKPKKLPQIVIIVDELADLMMVAPGEVEDAICRLAQLARACGIHLIIATQRPSVNVITGLIKANMPSRIAFSVSSGVDSRTIIDMNGAEKLLGKGDMLFYPQGYQKPARVQGAFVSDEEVADVVDFLKNKNTDVSYNAEMEEQIAKVQQAVSSARAAEDVDALFTDAGKFIIEKDKASIGMLQRVFKIGFNRAARIMDQLSEAGVVGPEEGTKPRKILMSAEQFENYLEENG